MPRDFKDEDEIAKTQSVFKAANKARFFTKEEIKAAQTAFEPLDMTNAYERLATTEFPYQMAGTQTVTFSHSGIVKDAQEKEKEPKAKIVTPEEEAQKVTQPAPAQKTDEQDAASTGQASAKNEDGKKYTVKKGALLTSDNRKVSFGAENNAEAVRDEFEAYLKDFRDPNKRPRLGALAFMGSHPSKERMIMDQLGGPENHRDIKYIAYLTATGKIDKKTALQNLPKKEILTHVHSQPSEEALLQWARKKEVSNKVESLLKEQGIEDKTQTALVTEFLTRHEDMGPVADRILATDLNDTDQTEKMSKMVGGMAEFLEERPSDGAKARQIGVYRKEVEPPESVSKRVGELLKQRGINDEAKAKQVAEYIKETDDLKPVKDKVLALDPKKPGEYMPMMMDNMSKFLATNPAPAEKAKMAKTFQGQLKSIEKMEAKFAGGKQPKAQTNPLKTEGNKLPPHIQKAAQEQSGKAAAQKDGGVPKAESKETADNNSGTSKIPFKQGLKQDASAADTSNKVAFTKKQPLFDHDKAAAAKADNIARRQKKSNIKKPKI